MTTKQMSDSQLTPTNIEVDEMVGTITITMPLADMDTRSESGKMDVLCTTNGWRKTKLVCPRTAEKIQVNIFVGTRA